MMWVAVVVAAAAAAGHYRDENDSRSVSLKIYTIE